MQNTSNRRSDNKQFQMDNRSKFCQLVPLMYSRTFKKLSQTLHNQVQSADERTTTWPQSI